MLAPGEPCVTNRTPPIPADRAAPGFAFNSDLNPIHRPS
jgi:hypothetical protein